MLLRWRTGHEVSNLGFHVYRDGVRVTESLIAGSALLAGPQTALTAGNAYTWFDAAGTAASTYTIEDVDLNGTKTVHGPFGVGADTGAAAPSALQRGTRRRVARSPAAAPAAVSRLIRDVGRPGSDSGRWFSSRPEEGLAPDTLTAPDAFAAADSITPSTLAGGPAVKISVRDAGWYHVDAAALVAAGMPAYVSPITLQVFVQGQERALQVVQRRGVVSAVEFYAAGADTPWSDTQVGWLTWGRQVGERVQIDGGRASGTPPASFPFTVQWRPRTVYFAALKNGEAENFFGPVLEPTAPVTQALPVTNVHAGAPGTSVLTVRMQGGTAGPHVVLVQLNGAAVGSLVFQDQESGVGSFAVPNAALAAGATLTLTAQGGGNDVTAVDTVTLTYPRRYVAEADTLRCTAGSRQPVVITGFTTGAVRVLDVTDPAHPLALRGTVALQADGSYGISVVAPSGGTRTLLAVTDAAMLAPAGVEANAPSSWRTGQAGADLVIISHEAFVGSLGPLVALRQGQGLTVAVVNVEDLYDEFNGGVPTPYAIKDFLSYAQTAWTKAPRWVLLVGDATMDPRDYLGTHQVNYVPTELVATAYLETASDDWFGDRNLDGLPEVAIGRLPVHTVSDATALVGEDRGV